MGKWVPRAALWAVLVLMLAGTLASMGPAQAGSTPTYTLQGYVEGTSPGGFPAGVTVVLTSSATQSTYSTTTIGSGGQFSFVSTGNAPGLAPGWWQLSVPPQTHVALTGIAGEWAVFPQNRTAPYVYLNATTLTTSYSQTVPGVSYEQENVTINGTVTYQTKAYGAAQVSVIDPAEGGFVLANNTTSTITNKTLGLHVGYFSLQVPYGKWVLQTVIPGGLSYTDDEPITIDASTAPATGNLTINPAVVQSGSYTTWGYLYLASNHGTRDPNGGNATVYEPSTGWVSWVPLSGGYYSFGTLGAGNYEVVLSSIGYESLWYNLTVSSGNPTGGSPFYSYVTPVATPANYTTTLDWSGGFQKLNVTTQVHLANDSVFPTLPNASVGQIWAQLGLDWQHNLSFKASNFATVANWLDSSGPFFPAGQSDTTINNTVYGQPTNYTFSSSTTCATTCGLDSPATATFTYTQAYNVTAKLNSGQKSYSGSFDFKHPTNSQTYNYTVILPKGYVLSAGTPVPSQSALVAAGPGGTWTSFTLVSKPSPGAFGTFSFSVVKNGSMTASVNISADQFTWSSKNVLNQSRGNYTAISEAGENLTFSGLNSTFPAGTNGTNYAWNFGDGSNVSTANATTNHTYAGHGEYAGSLTVTSSGGAKSTVPFWVYVGSEKPTAVITVNDTKILKASNNEPYIIVNWSTPLQLNATGSTSVINAGSNAPAGRLSVAYWNITDSSSQTYNFSQALSQNPLSNITQTFGGQGHYITQGSANGTAIPGSFFGWQYNITLTVWDYGGLNDTTHMVVLVRDTQKPLPVILIKNGGGKVVPASGLVEASNHTALAVFWATNSSDPNNGSIVQYHWKINDTGNSSVLDTFTRNTTGPNFPLPAGIPVWLPPQQTAYTVNLTVTDRAGNTNYVTASLTVAVNLSTRPVLAVSNLTAPSSMTDGSTYTVTVNVTNIGGKNSTALGTQVRFYLLPPSGSGSEIEIGGAPGSVNFYEWTNNTTLASSAAGTGSVSIPYNETYRAEIRFTPARTGTWDLWVNATATNEFVPDYTSGENLAHVQVSFAENPVVQDETYAAIAVVVVAAIVVIYLVFVKRIGRGGGKPGSSKGGSSSSSKLERGGKKDKDDDDDDE